MTISCPICKTPHEVLELAHAVPVSQSACLGCKATFVFLVPSLRPRPEPASRAAQMPAAVPRAGRMPGAVARPAPQARSGHFVDPLVRKLLTTLVALILLIAGVAAGYAWVLNTDAYRHAVAFIEAHSEIAEFTGRPSRVGFMPTFSYARVHGLPLVSFGIWLSGPLGSTRVEIAMLEVGSGWRIIKAAYPDERGLTRTLVNNYGRTTSKKGVASIKLVERAQAFLGDGRPEEALAAFADAISLDPENVEACFHRSLYFKSQGRQEEALADMERVIELEPDNLQAHIEYDLMLVVTAEWDRIIAAWDRYIERNPDSVRAYDERGGTHFRKRDLTAALKDAKAACDLGSEEGCLHLNWLRQRVRR